MDEKILCVDDELNLLLSLQRQLRKQFHIDSALGPEKALAAIEREAPYAVVVSDLQMPGMNGLELLARVKELSPESVRIMLTGQADLETAIAAVNQGNIFRFLTKPCSAEELAHTLTAALEQHRLVTAERNLLENTLHASVKVLTEVLSLVHPAAFSRASRIHRYVRHMAAVRKLPDAWQFEVAALLSQVGGDRALLKRLIAIFLADSPNGLARIQDALEHQDIESLKRAAHAFRGSVSIFAAPAAVHSAVNLETLARVGNLSQAMDAFARLQRDVARLQQALATLGVARSPRKTGRPENLARSSKRTQ